MEDRFVFYQLGNIVFVDMCNFDEDQITIQDPRQINAEKQKIMLII